MNKNYKILDTFKTKKEAYEYFNITPNNYGIVLLNDIADKCGFDLDIYKERRKPHKRYCLTCGKLITKKENKFCDSSCFATYNNKNRTLSDETKTKISNKLLNRNTKEEYRLNPNNKCKICGENICLDKEVCNHNINWFNNLVCFGFNLDTIGTVNIYNEYNKFKTLLLSEYNDGLSPKDISIKYNFTLNSENILTYLKGFGIQTRNKEESMLNSLKQGKMKHIFNPNSRYQFNCGWFNKWDGEQIYYRSSYELKYINKLNEQKIDFGVECFRIEYWDTLNSKYRIAIPDIFIKNENKIIEIKSKFTFNKQNMIDRFDEYKKLGYNVLLVLDNIEYEYFDIESIVENDYTIEDMRKK